MMVSTTIPWRPAWPLALFCFSLVLLFAGAAAAHPFHTTTLEAEFNASTNTLESSLRVDPAALNLVIKEREGEPLALRKIGRKHAVLERWLNKRMHFTSSHGERLPVIFAGYKVEKDGLWLFFTVKLEAGLRGVRMLSSAFFEREPKQMNAVMIRQGEDLVFSHIFTGRGAHPALILR